MLRSRASSTALGLLLTVALVGCRVVGEVTVDVARDGSGTVAVGAGFDDAALAELGDLETALRTEDLAEAGWRITDPERRGELTWVTATTPFGSPEDLQRVMAQIGAFEDWSASVSSGFARTTWRVGGRVVLSGSLEQFSDADLTAALDGLPFGRTPEELAQLDPIPVRVRVRLPAETDQPDEWSFLVGDGTPVDRRLEVDATERSPTPWWWFGGAAAALLVAVVVWRSGRRRADRE